MTRVAPAAELVFALAGVLAVKAMGGSWIFVLALIALAGVAAPVVRRRAELAAMWTARRTRLADQVRTVRQQQFHDLWRLTKIIAAVMLVWTMVSFTRYVGHDNGDTFSERVATWGRDNYLGSVIDLLETHLYSTPPSKAPAQQLALSTPAVRRPSSTPSQAAPVAAPVAAPAAAPAATGTVPSASKPVLAPSPLMPLFAPALAGEGQWSPIARAGGQDAMWATSIRPLASAGGVVASMVVIDQTHLRAGLFNGAEQPGGTWKRGNRVPASLQPALLAAMNGGFRFEHIKGGYKTEGVTVKPLRVGDATLAVGTDGRIAVGQLGRDLFDDGSWVSLRQDLVLIVDRGQSQVQRGIDEGVWWGADYGNKVYVPRSAVCELVDGRIAYTLVGNVDATQLAESLIALGCVKAIQMDINGTWPVFFTFTTGSDGTVAGHFLDRRMGGDPTRYLTGSTKEFFGFFDSGLVPAGSVLDS